MTDVALHVYESDNATLVGEIEPGQWKSARVAVIPLGGLGTIVLPRTLDGTDPNPAIALLTDGRLVRFTGDFGAWTMEVEDGDDQIVSTDEEVTEDLTIKGRDWLTARAAKTTLRPDAGLENLPHHPTRWFNHSADRLRDDDPDGPQGVWPHAVEQDPDYDGANYMGRPEGYLDTSGPWIADRDSRLTPFAPAGVWFFRHYVTLSQDYDATLNQLAADDEGELWIDNVPVCRVEGVYLGGCAQSVVPMAAGEHLISGWVRNLNALRTGALASGWSMSDGMADELLWRLDDTARVLGFPDDPPGFTPTEIIRLVVDEEQTAGGLPGVGFSFISATDTASTPVDEITDIATRAPGSTLLTLLQLLEASYLDIDCQPTTLTIDAWVRGTRGEDRTADVVFERETATSIKHTRQGSLRATAAMVEGSGFAPFEVRHVDYSTLTRTTVSLDYGEASKATAERWAREYLDTVARARRGIEVRLHPGGPFIPGDDFNIGDTVCVLESDGTVGEHRVASWGFEIDAESIVHYNLELDQPVVELEERLDALMRRQMPGGVGGRTILPSPVEPSFPSQTKPRETSEEWQWKGPPGTVQLIIDGAAVTGASATVGTNGLDKVTVARPHGRYTKGVSKIRVSVDGVLMPVWTPPTGRWVQEMTVTDTDGETSVITVKVV